MDIVALKAKLKDVNVVLPNNKFNSNLKFVLNKYLDILEQVELHTKFLGDVSLFQRVYTIMNDITTTPVCSNHDCNQPVKFKRTYNSFCSNICLSTDKHIQEKKKQTSLKNYGVENPSQSELIKDKKIETTLKNYDVENPFQSKKIKEKIKERCNEEYNCDHYVQSEEFKKKYTKSMNEKYGVDHALQSPDIYKKMQASIFKKYDVDHISKRHVSKDTYNKLNDKKWMVDEHINKKIPLYKMADDLDVLDWTVGKYLHSHGIETQNHFSSTGEQAVLSFINSLNIDTIPNTRKIIPPYELDIYIPEHNLAIEYCGLYWHSEQAGKNKNYHERKFNLCKALGIQLITIFEDEWFNRQEQVKFKLLSLLHKDIRPKIFARKTQITSVSKQTKKTFFDENHIQGNGPGSINIGLAYDNNLVACMSFIKRKNDNYELNRYATSAQVTGGFSKLLKHFINEYAPKEIISFADLRWSTGNLYLKTGWQVDKTLLPDYSYSPDAKQRHHKFGYRRKNLDKLLSNFDPNLSERVNCDNNGILRIWDCGKIRFTYPLDN